MTVSRHIGHTLSSKLGVWENLRQAHVGNESGKVGHNLHYCVCCVPDTILLNTECGAEVALLLLHEKPSSFAVCASHRLLVLLSLLTSCRVCVDEMQNQFGNWKETKYYSFHDENETNISSATAFQNIFPMHPSLAELKLVQELYTPHILEMHPPHSTSVNFNQSNPAAFYICSRQLSVQYSALFMLAKK